jgi:hypothetical protein
MSRRHTYYGAFASFTNAFSTLFNGINQFLNFGNTLAFERTNSFSFSLWVFPNALGTIGFISKVAGNRGYNLVYVSGNLRFQLGSGPGNILDVTFGALTNSVWQHVVITYNGTSVPSGLNCYVNGTIRSKTIITNALTGTVVTNANLQIAASNGGLNFFNGNVDELLCTNTELTLAQVLSIYNSGTPKNEIALTGLILYNRIGDNTSGATWISEVGVNATNVNGATLSTNVP